MKASTLNKPRLLDCQFCSGAGVLRAVFLKPSGKHSKPVVTACPQCQGRSGQIVGGAR